MVWPEPTDTGHEVVEVGEGKMKEVWSPDWADKDLWVLCYIERKAHTDCS